MSLAADGSRYKTADENYYLLTLAAIAKEIAYRNAPTTTPVILAAGLPLTSFGREKKAFRAYLLRESKLVSFSYEGISYEISVQDVNLFPQGYAAILQHSDLLNEPSVILADIGGWTVDIMRLDNRIPNAASCRSLELGMIRCLDEIAEQVRRSLNLSLTGAQIENVLRGSPDSMALGFFTVRAMYAARRNAPLRCAQRFIRPDPLSGGERRTRNIKTAC